MGYEKNWEVKIERPEEVYDGPEEYYDKERVKKYNRSGGMKRAQYRIGKRIVELLAENGFNGNSILDLGCGTGYTMEVYRENEFEIVGIDKIPEMLDKARKKGLNVEKCDMTNLSFKKEFDAVVSASAFQWLSLEEARKAARQIRGVLKKDGLVVIQFYPKSEKEMYKVARQFKREGFKGEIIIDNPDRPKKREIYLVFNLEE